MTPRHFLPVLCAAFAAAGCTPIFDADFEADPANGAPLAAPPGPPAGDLVDFGAGPGAVYVTTALPLEGDQSLRLDGPSGASAPRAFLRAAPIFDQTKPVFLSWAGRLGSGAQVEFNVVVAETGAVPFTLNFEQGIVYANGNAIGTYAGTAPHGVWVSLNPTTDEWAVNLSDGASVNGGGVASGSFPNPADFPGAHLVLSVELQNATGPTGYWMDRVKMSHWK